LPAWRKHREFAKKLGIKHIREVDRFLDFPKVGNFKLPHRSFHGLLGVLLVKQKYGEEAAQYACTHILQDFLEDWKLKALKQILKKIL